jgi:pimeloyl-ACP methyl ester carboxylesterase
MAYYTQATAIAPSPQSPTLVFLHSLGGGSSAYEWSQVYGALAADYPIVAPDLVGWGQSAHPIHTYQVVDYCHIIAHLLETVVTGPRVVMASSLTAGVVIRLATQRPDLFQRLILVSPSGNDDFGKGYRYTLPALLAGTPGLDQLIYTLGAANETAVRQFLTTFLFAHPERLSATTVAAYLAGTQQPQARYSALASLRGDICLDLSRYLGQLTVPTQFLWGEKSRFSPPQQGKRLAALSPAIAPIQVLPDVGVLPQVEYPALVVGVLRAHLLGAPTAVAPSGG